MNRRSLFSRILAGIGVLVAGKKPVIEYKAKAATALVNSSPFGPGCEHAPIDVNARLFDWMAEHRPDGYCARYKRRLALMNFQTACGQDLIEQEEDRLAIEEWDLMIS